MPAFSNDYYGLIFRATQSVELFCTYVVNVVDVLNLILKDAKKMGVKLFIVITANEYELCRRNKCFDVNSGQYIEFKDYEDYRKFILESREKKDKRYE